MNIPPKAVLTGLVRRARPNLLHFIARAAQLAIGPFRALFDLYCPVDGDVGQGNI